MRTLLGLTLSWTLFLPLLFSEVQQAHVDPRTITLPVVDGKGIRFTRLSTDEGLSQTKVTRIVQDDQGFMWFGTQYGLNRYDGYNFKLFVHDPKNPNSLSGVYVNGLFKDRDGALWVGCDQFSISSIERPRRLHGTRFRSSSALARTAPEYCGWQLATAYTV